MARDVSRGSLTDTSHQTVDNVEDGPSRFARPFRVLISAVKRLRRASEQPQPHVDKLSLWASILKLLKRPSNLSLLLVTVPILTYFRKINELAVFFVSISLLPLFAHRVEHATIEVSNRLNTVWAAYFNFTFGHLGMVIVLGGAIVKCKLKLVQETILGGFLTDGIVLAGMSLFAGGFKYSELSMRSFQPNFVIVMLVALSFSLFFPSAVYYSNLAAYFGYQVAYESHLVSDPPPAFDLQASLKDSRYGSVFTLIYYILSLAMPLITHPPKNPEEASAAHPGYRVWRFLILRPAKSAMDDIPNQRFVEQTDATRSTKPCQANNDVQNTHDNNVQPRISTSDSMQDEIQEVPAERVANLNRPRSHSHHSHSHHSHSLIDIMDDGSVGNDGELREPPKMHLAAAIGDLFLSIAAIVVITGPMLDALQTFTDKFHIIPQTVVNTFLFNVVGDLPEHWIAVYSAIQDNLDLTMEISFGGASQMPGAVFPIVTIFAWALRKPLAMVFAPIQLLAVACASATMITVTAYRRLTWYHGLTMLFATGLCVIGIWHTNSDIIPQLPCH